MGHRLIKKRYGGKYGREISRFPSLGWQHSFNPESLLPIQDAEGRGLLTIELGLRTGSLLHSGPVQNIVESRLATIKLGGRYALVESRYFKRDRSGSKSSRKIPKVVQLKGLKNLPWDKH
jgi:hypothetical protein